MSARTGALNLYSARTGAFADRDVIDTALVYAVHATNALSSARRASTLQTAVSSRHVIGMAQGMRWSAAASTSTRASS